MEGVCFPAWEPVWAESQCPTRVSFQSLCECPLLREAPHLTPQECVPGSPSGVSGGLASLGSSWVFGVGAEHLHLYVVCWSGTWDVEHSMASPPGKVCSPPRPGVQAGLPRQAASAGVRALLCFVSEACARAPQPTPDRVLAPQGRVPATGGRGVPASVRGQHGLQPDPHLPGPRRLLLQHPG